MKAVDSMVRMTQRPLTLALALLLPAGCASSRFDQYWESGQYVEAIRDFEDDPSLQTKDRAIFRAAVAHTRPDSPVFDPGRAEELLRRLLARHPGSDHAEEASRLLALVIHVGQLNEAAGRRERELEELTAEMKALEERVSLAELLLEHQTTRADLLQELKERLERDLREAQNQLRNLQEELRQLKEVDLKRTGGRTVHPTS